MCKSQHHEQMMNILNNADTTPLCINLKNNCFGLCFQTTESALDDDKLSTPICYVSMNDIQTTEDTTEKPDEAQITFDIK